MNLSDFFSCEVFFTLHSRAVVPSRTVFYVCSHISRSSHQRCSVRKGILRNFAKFTGKYVRRATLSKKRPWHRCFPVNFAVSKKTFFKESLRVTASIVSFWLTRIFKSPNHQCRCSKTNVEIDCVSTSQDNIANGSNYILLLESFLRRIVGQSFWKKHLKPYIILFLIPCSSMYL